MTQDRPADRTENRSLNRRSLLRLGLAGVIGAAGCSSGTDDPGTETTGEPGTETTTSATVSLFQQREYCQDGNQAATPTESTTGIPPKHARHRHLSCLGRPIEEFESADSIEALEGWSVWDGDVTVTDETAAVGSQSVHLRIAPDVERAGIARWFDRGVDLSSYDLSLATRLVAPENEAILLQLLAPDRDNAVMSKGYCHDGGWLRHDHGPTSVRGKPDLTDVRAIRIGMYRGTDATGEFYVDSLRAAPRRDRGGVVFTFDDGHTTQFDPGFTVLQEYGYPGAISVIPWEVENDDRIGVERLREMQSAGWHVVSHPQVSGTPIPDMEPTRQQEVIRDSYRWLRDNGFESGSRFITWPFGQYDGRSLAIADRYHDIGFSTATSTVGRITDPLVLPRVNGGNVENAKLMIDLAERFDTVCILMYHRIADIDRDIQVSPDAFRETVSYVDSADVDVLSVADLRSEVRSAAV